MLLETAEHQGWHVLQMYQDKGSLQIQTLRRLFMRRPLKLILPATA